MKKLEIDFDFKGFHYHQEWRDENFAIYSQWSDGELMSYESIKIRKNKPSERFGRVFEATESYPNDKSWGKEGFTSKTFEEAQGILIKHFGSIFNLPNLGSPMNKRATFSG